MNKADKERVKLEFETSVLERMRNSCGVAPGQKLIVAVSGGADSVALLAALTALGYDCVAAHCNFHLRGAESQRDMHHVETLADALKVNLSIRHFDVPAYMLSTGTSVEMACRELRYRWFTELLERHRATAVAVAHHREDQVETFMLNLLRGTGIAGLTGMSHRNGLIVRPLLNISRQNIEKYLDARNISYIVDSSNADNDFRRNRIRNIIVPALQENFDGATESILSTMDNLQGQHLLYNFAVKELAGRFFSEDGNSLDLKGLKNTYPPEIARILLFEFLKSQGFRMTQIENMLSAGDEAVFFYSPDTLGELSRGQLTLSMRRTAENTTSRVSCVSLRWPILIPSPITVERLHISHFNPVKNSGEMYLDETVLQQQEDEEAAPVFVVRHWQHADRFQPYGMKGEKLVSDLFTDAKFSPAQKRETWILTRNGKILWVAGVRASSLFPVTPRTRYFLRLSLNSKG